MPWSGRWEGSSSNGRQGRFGWPIQYADFHSIPIFTTTCCPNPHPFSFKLLHKIKPDLLACQKGYEGLVVLANFLATLLSLATPQPKPTKRFVLVYEPAHFLSKLLEDGLHKNKGIIQEKLIKMTRNFKRNQKREG